MHAWQKTTLALALAGAMGLAQAQILVGQTAGFTGQVSAGVLETTDGAKLYLDAINARGGVHGQKIELISLDDKYDPKIASENARALIEDKKVDVMFLTRATPHSLAVVPYLNQYGLALVAPSTGAMALHQPVLKYVFNVRATYQREAERAIAHLASLGMTRIAVLYVDDGFGTDGMTGALKGLKDAQLEPVVLEKYDRAKPDFAPLVTRIVNTRAQAVLMVSSAIAVRDATAQMRKAGSSAQVVTLSNNASSGFIKALDKNAHGVIVAQVFPGERNLAYPMVREATALAKAQGDKELTPSMLEGFAAAKVLVEGLRRAGPKPTREKIAAALDGMQKYDLGGLEVGYSPSDHTGLDFVDLSIIDAKGRFRR